MFTLQFLGAAGQVTGSKYFLRTSTHRGTMIDCGLFQGPKELRERNWDDLPLLISDVHNIVLTHAHLDHTGYLPRLVHKGFNGTIWANAATQEVTNFILRDSAHLQEEDAADANKHKRSKHHPALPLYSSEDAERALSLIQTVERHKTKVLPDDLSFTYYNAGHILGSNFIVLEKRFNEGQPIRILFSGDIGRDHPVYLKPKEDPVDVDYIVCESTYGDRLHPAIDPIEEFDAILQQAIAEKQVLLVPAFAVDRVQELIYALDRLLYHKRIPSIPVYIDSPMATGVTALYEKYSDEHLITPEDDSNPLSIPSLHFVRTPDESKALNKLSGPAIIISASGMATGGRVLHHLKFRLSDPKTTVLLTGYQAEETLGRQLLEGSQSVSIHGEYIEIHAKILQLTNFSGHADQSEIMSWLRKIKKAPKKIFLTHGEDRQRRTLAALIKRDLGWDVVLPRLNETIDLVAE